VIGVFDSGIGGLTVFKEIARRFPALDILYLGDTARVPYGTKSPETVVRYSFEAAHFLGKHGIELLVVACNTSSALALDALERDLPIPVIGVIRPGAQRAAGVTRSGRIGVIGTPATIRSGAYARALEAAAASAGTSAAGSAGTSAAASAAASAVASAVASAATSDAPGAGATQPPPVGRPAGPLTVISATCPLFVPLAEEGWTDNAVARETARLYLDPIARERIDTLVLGCTHYPILSGVIGEVMGTDVTLVDSAVPVADEVGARLRAQGRDPGAGGGTRRFFVTDSWERFLEVGARFLGHPIERPEQVSIVGE